MSTMASAAHVYKTFRKLGLRHCYVVTTAGFVVGVITRADLLPAHVLTCLHRIKQAEGRGRFSIAAENKRWNDLSYLSTRRGGEDLQSRAIEDEPESISRGSLNSMFSPPVFRSDEAL